MTSAFIMGAVLLALTVAMVVIGRPKDGVSAPFLKVWVVGQAYVLAAMASAVAGTAMVIVNWPF
jgi:hypothetical protein